MPDQKPIKILLMEDETMLSSMYQTKFKNEGLVVATAPDGEAGLAKAKAEQFDIVLVDIIMPKLDGFAALKELRSLEQYKTTPIILLTNLGQEEDIKKGQSLGATDYLVKANFTPSQVAAKIKEILSQSKK
ncbi:MAG: hypothetical protein A3H70_01455 [Candidatus Komeilibacteria bacterium RIFCSPLOWO2_02_FULL_48_11]|uniref:Response regulatory domain-containing protein n=1 Tax=Candidatus Komeilibacteria bacterium RIFCSPLOWO2_02_FULL_48_11 TaxID=1798553 RepID=A0A1G2BRB0_9BACT|nr:MAG: hypothetical protein A3H70_01455 [Candidatus Komeilibacteria bacterium RIFCSPLOWO2_02_FULL_48_11]